ncbi:MAG TPA: Sir2 family NAD-dependent protein deacetylase [Saprospiraceae bacterium]|nr:Sir2 family NAD-dependent protein deacetylase [Saprospiraceae bacterium]
MNKPCAVVLTGAGISAESGLQTFRDAGGLWEGYSIYEVATPEAWERQPQVVLDFYNWRREQLLAVQPNKAHQLVMQLETVYDVQIITQNVDDLHERAGSRSVLHLHGALRQVRCTKPGHSEIIPWDGPLTLLDTCSAGHPLRPHIVWFGEDVPAMTHAISKMPEADLLIIIGTSLQVYPAAGLTGYVRPDCRIYYIDPNPADSYDLRHLNPTIIQSTAVAGMETLYQLLNLPKPDSR